MSSLGRSVAAGLKARRDVRCDRQQRAEARGVERAEHVGQTPPPAAIGRAEAQEHAGQPRTAHDGRAELRRPAPGVDARRAHARRADQQRERLRLHRGRRPTREVGRADRGERDAEQRHPDPCGPREELACGEPEAVGPVVAWARDIGPHPRRLLDALGRARVVQRCDEGMLARRDSARRDGGPAAVERHAAARALGEVVTVPRGDERLRRAPGIGRAIGEPLRSGLEHTAEAHGPAHSMPGGHGRHDLEARRRRPRA